MKISDKITLHQIAVATESAGPSRKRRHRRFPPWAVTLTIAICGLALAILELARQNGA